MSEDRPSEVLGGLPRTRPHRRSEKRRPPANSEAVQAATEAVQAASEAKPATRAKAKPKPKPTAKRAAAKPATPKPAAAKPATPKPAAAKPATPKRATAKPAAPKTASRGRLRQPAQPAGAPSASGATERPRSARREPPPTRKPGPPRGGEIIGTAVQAAAELAEIGLSVGARAIRRAVSRLPRP
jgi:hypothetical protein